MDALTSLAGGFADALTPINLLWCLVGVVLGTAVGVLPGIGPAMALALLLPLTFSLDATSALIMFAGLYYGGMYGGSTTSILLNTPGESASVVTAIEGNRMAKAGRAAQALGTAAIGSFVAGTIATALVVLLAQPIVQLALQMQPADYFAITVLAFIAVSATLGASRVRGFASLLLGLTIGLVGIDVVTGQQRLTFGVGELADGIEIVTIAVGLFAVGETLWVAAHLRRRPADIIRVGSGRMSREDLSRSWKPWLRGTAIGFPFGAIPAGGAEIPTFLSYVTEKRLSRRPEEFGRGAIEGVAGPESANNASAAASFIPLLTFGIPVTATAAVLIAAFESYGIQPGPRLFATEAALVWALLASLFIANLLLVVLNLPLAPVWARLLHLPRPYLYAGILFFASLGAYAAQSSAFNLVLLLVVGALGFLMRRFGLPLVPAIIGVILVGVSEDQLRRSLQINQGELSGLVATPFSVVVYVIVAAVLLWPLARPFVRRRRGGDGPDGGHESLLAAAVHSLEASHHHEPVPTSAGRGPSAAGAGGPGGPGGLGGPGAGHPPDRRDR